MPRINVGGINLYYELRGAGHPLILISGFTCDSLFWAPVFPQLERHFQLLIFDNRGSGRSDSPDISYSIDMMAQDTLKLAAELKLKQPHVLGHSMGGCITQTLAYQNAKNFSKFVICNSLIKLNPISAYYETFNLHLREAGVSEKLLLESIYPWLFSADFLQDKARIERVLDWGLKNPYPQSVIGYRRQLEALTAFDSSAWYSQIEAPVLVIDGMEDILCPHDSEKLAKEIPGAHYIPFPHIGHLPMIEEPEVFCNFIIHFLNKGSTSS